MSTLQARLAVRRGAALLDEKCDYSDWRSRIDLETLNLGSTSDCVLAQVYKRGYYATLARLDLSEAEAAKLGFESSHQYTARELTSAWVEYLKPKSAPSGGAESLWEHKNNANRNIRIGGGTVTISGQDYWPVSYGYMMGDEFFASGDPTLMRTADLYMEYKLHVPKPEFPVGSFLTDKRTGEIILFVAPGDIVYRMSTCGSTMNYNTGLEWYVEEYGEFVPVKNPLDDKDLIIKVAES